MLLLLLMLHTAWNMQNTQSHAFGCYRLPDPLDGMHTYAVLGIYINFMLLLLLLLHTSLNIHKNSIPGVAEPMVL